MTVTVADPVACTECDGKGTVEKYRTFVGLVDAACEAEGCDDGIVR